MKALTTESVLGLLKALDSKTPDVLEPIFINVVALSEAVSMMEENIKMDRFRIVESLESLFVMDEINFENDQVVKTAIKCYSNDRIRFSNALQRSLNQSAQTSGQWSPESKRLWLADIFRKGIGK